MFDVEHGHRRRAATANARLQRAHQAFAEQAALGQAGERVEIRQEADFVFLVHVLQREGQVRHQFAQHARFLVAHGADVVGSEQQGAHRCAVHEHWIGDDAAEPGVEQGRTCRERHVQRMQVIADQRRARTKDAADDAGVVLRILGDAEGELLRTLAVHAAGPGRGPGRACAGLYQRDDGAGVSAHRSGETAGFGENLAPLPDAHHGAVHAREHLQHAREAADVFFLAPALGDVALAPAETRHLPLLAQQHQHVAFQPAITAIAMTPAGLEIGGRALVGTQRVHGEVERRQILGVHVLRCIRTQQFGGCVSQSAAHRVAAEGEFSLAVVFPDPVLRGDHDVTQLLLESAARAAAAGFAERAANRRHQARHVGLEHVIVGTALQRIDGALLADGSGEEDERNVGFHFPRDFQRGNAVETRQREIGKDQVGLDLIEHAPQCRLGIDALPVAGEPPGFELTDGDFRLRRHVFHYHQFHRLHLCLPRD